ncbi:unnamed protein product [Microthlaspi erraticum]|uniref:HMA domain-containing protein n=1 Tax=Microthlaspi erraticum TaxID=1685480 RepID=A0A6D2IKA3_9BRAS|nr:unnamed protein product [Microthlaspi erraticum]
MESSSSSSKHMVCLLEIKSPRPGWEKSLEELLKTIKDVNFTIDKQSRTIYVCGKFDPQIILEKITKAKAGKKAEIVWSYQRSKKPPVGNENQKDHLMEQSHSSGYINAAPNGFSSFRQQQQQWYNPPPHCVNQFQPYPQPCPLPPPYTRQLHPQPSLPTLPYMFHQNEPAAKAFPPTPPPPKNFAMGDLQPGCSIM